MAKVADGLDTCHTNFPRKAPKVVRYARIVNLVRQVSAAERRLGRLVCKADGPMAGPLLWASMDAVEAPDEREFVLELLPRA